MGDAAYARQHPLPDSVRRAVRAILAGRPAVWGGPVQACPEGQVDRIWDHAGRHRMCPPCAWVQVERWRAQQQGRRLACAHDQVIFTRPHALHDWWLATVGGMTPGLLASGHETRLERLGEGKLLGAKPGLSATRPPWTQTRLLHPPVPGLVTGGGLTASGDWVAVRNGVLLPMRGVMAGLRGKRLAAIRQGVRQGTLKLPPGQRPQPGDNLLNKLGRMKWHVHIRARYPYGPGVLVYLARYWRGGPIATRRLRACDGEPVSWGDEERATGPGGQATRRTLRLPLGPCSGRWRLQVPSPGAVLGRRWGLYASTQGAAVAVCRQQLDQGPVEAPPPWAWPRACAERGAAHPECCPVCGRRLVCTAISPRAGVPPPAAAAWEPGA
jgi:Putative transposase/Transposase zinc-binding domain